MLMGSHTFSKSTVCSGLLRQQTCSTIAQNYLLTQQVPAWKTSFTSFITSQAAAGSIFHDKNHNNMSAAVREEKGVAMGID